MKSNASMIDFTLEDKYVSSDPDWCPVDKWSIRMINENINTSPPNIPDHEMMYNSWVYNEPTLGHILRLFPSYEGNWTIYVMGNTVGNKWDYITVNFEITHCSVLTNSIYIIDNTDRIVNWDKNTGWSNYISFSDIQNEVFEVTDSRCPIWKYDVYDQNRMPITEDSDLYGRIYWDDMHDYFNANPWETFADQVSWYANRYWPEFQVDRFVPMTDGTVVYFWLNFTLRVESKGEVVKFYP
jgi:hypothetical protein